MESLIGSSEKSEEIFIKVILLFLQFNYLMINEKNIESSIVLKPEKININYLYFNIKF